MPYEARIRDWSSDVCASDLHDLVEGVVGDVLRRAEEGIDRGIADQDLDAPPLLHRRLGQRLQLGLVRYELGRASCWARVCQSVYVSVVAVSLKKKSIQLYLLIFTIILHINHFHLFLY